MLIVCSSPPLPLSLSLSLFPPLPLSLSLSLPPPSLSLSVSLSLPSLFSAYKFHVVPLLVSQCDEATLESLSADVLSTSLHDLLKESLPACMVLILTSYTEQSRGGGDGGGASEKDKQMASDSHNLLTKLLSEEVTFYQLCGRVCVCVCRT